MRKVDQEYAIAITIIVVLVCEPSYRSTFDDDMSPGLHLPADDGAGQECCPRRPGQDLVNSKNNHILICVMWY